MKITLPAGQNELILTIEGSSTRVALQLNGRQQALGEQLTPALLSRLDAVLRGPLSDLVLGVRDTHALHFGFGLYGPFGTVYSAEQRDCLLLFYLPFIGGAALLGPLELSAADRQHWLATLTPLRAAAVLEAPLEKIVPSEAVAAWLRGDPWRGAGLALESGDSQIVFAATDPAENCDFLVASDGVRGWLGQGHRRALLRLLGVAMNDEPAVGADKPMILGKIGGQDVCWVLDVGWPEFTLCMNDHAGLRRFYLLDEFRRIAATLVLTAQDRQRWKTQIQDELDQLGAAPATVE